MPTIKRKVEMNLPQLIEWGFENDISCRFFESNRSDIKGKVFFDNNGMVDIQISVCKNETFTVEVEEVVDENTELTALVELNSRGLLGNTKLYRYHSINDVIDNQSVAFYILNDDQTMDLIWKNGRLVE